MASKTKPPRHEVGGMRGYYPLHSRNTRMIVHQHVYAPTNQVTDKEGVFYHKMQGVIDKLPKSDVNSAEGKLNAKNGVDNSRNEEVIGMHGLEGANGRVL
ncbi:hypothetical protein ElyMa_003701300 [Elysia marginata]|uniref:Uncharacterized protein n=1 Tax=Elysia marginata TaxID=1093978 RepID=A0AAV4F2U2_9GAST|nr:hypothetical protein ElyMa_003701300 [Elysia marginata]